MIHLERVAELTVSAASGCVVHGGVLHVVADDETSLHRYSLDGSPIDALQLIEDVMPADAAARKKVKPDFESLAVLPDGSLFTMGSGSTDQRRRGAVIRDGKVMIIDCAALFERLEREFSQVNIEGLVVHDGALVLGQRGNGTKRENALIRFELNDVIEELRRGVFTGDALKKVQSLELGELDGVPLSLTDLAVDANDTLHFSAAAEDTDDPYLDGECAGSVLGAFHDGHVKWSQPLSITTKIEGLAHEHGDRWLLVADADDPTVKAPLFRARS